MADTTNVYASIRPIIRNVRFINAGSSTKLSMRSQLVVRASGEHEFKAKKSGKSIEECEAHVVAGNALDTPVPPKPEAQNPAIPIFPLQSRPRRNHRSRVLRKAFQQSQLSPSNLVYPLFIHEGEEDDPIGSMPGCYRLGWRHGLLEEVSKARDVGVNSILLFPKVSDALKTPAGHEAYNENGLVPRAIRLLKDKYPDLVIYTDVALDPYSSDGHDGICREDGVIMNDEKHSFRCQLVLQSCSSAYFEIK